MTRLAGIVLCGGRSSRMGRPKAWLPFGDELLLPRVVRVVREAVGPVVVVAAPGQDVPPLPADVEVVRDEVEGLGPLGGLAAGLAALEGRADATYLSSCDVPFLTPAFVRRVVSFVAGADRPAVAVPVANGYHHPLAAAYSVAVLPQVRELLSAGQLRMTGLFAAVPTRALPPDELTDAESLRNVNTPDEYAAALARLTTDH
jgi:molybdopterin-guanine dinucleotide biosynthesis protein A